MTNDFKCFLEVDYIEKAKGGDDGEWRVGGIASDENIIDADGEVIEIDGMDTTPMLTAGYLKWEHSKDPGAFIGIIDKVEKRGRQLYIEGPLFKDLTTSRHVRELMKSLKKSGMGRRMAFSIEGKAEQRDPMNPKRIMKSTLTNCALTLAPKNKGTLAEIIKSKTGELEYDLIKSANGGEITELLVDITDQDSGQRITVDKNFTITITKAMMAEGNMKDLQKESIAGVSNKEKKLKMLTKSQVYNHLFGEVTTDIQKAKSIFNIIEKVNHQINPDMKEFSEDAIQKAMDLLNLASEGLQKSTEEPAEEETVIEKSEEPTEEEKASEPSLEEKYNSLKAEMEELKKSLTAKQEEENKEPVPSAEIKKSETLETPAKPQEDEFMKSLLESNKATQEFMKSMTDQISGLTSSLQQKEAENDEMRKSMHSIQNVTDEMGKRLKIIEKQPVERKSVTSQSYVDRFEKSDNGSAGDVETFSISRDKKRLLNKLDIITESDRDEDIIKAINNLECAGQIAGTQADVQKIAMKLRDKYKINITV